MDVTSSITKVGDLVREISAASREQAQGIEQINHAVGSVDKVVQENASNADKAASASTHMNQQAGTMIGFVERLLRLIDGNNAKLEQSAKKALPPSRAEARDHGAPPGRGKSRVREEGAAIGPVTARIGQKPRPASRGAAGNKAGEGHIEF